MAFRGIIIVRSIHPSIHSSTPAIWIASIYSKILTPTAALERTYLAYIRTSNVIASFGMFTIQLFILQLRRNRANPTARALLTAGKALTVIDVALAIMTVVVGTWRYFVMQRMLQRKRVLSRGPEILVLGGTTLVVSSVPCESFVFWYLV